MLREHKLVGGPLDGQVVRVPDSWDTLKMGWAPAIPVTALIKESPTAFTFQEHVYELAVDGSFRHAHQVFPPLPEVR